MKYLMLSRTDQESLMSELRAMPDFLEGSFATLSRLEASASGSNDAFSPVEHCWHLADLEREGYALRILAGRWPGGVSRGAAEEHCRAADARGDDWTRRASRKAWVRSRSATFQP
jgi:hypothetical protein